MSIHIGLIDSGIDINHPLIAKKENIVNGWKGEFDDFKDLLGHGTQCAQLILRAADYLSKIHNIKVFDKKLKTSTKNIIEALQWCIDNQMKLINLSISICDINYYYEFKKICDEAYKKNTIIVASADNAGYSCLPAYLNNVFGVGIASFETDDDFFYKDSSVQLYANGSS